MAAAQQVLASGLPMRIVTNDATCQLWLEGTGITRFQTTTLPHVKIVGQMLDVWLRYRSKIFNQKIKGTCPHDAFTLAVALNRVQYSSCNGVLEVDTDDAGTTFKLSAGSPIELVVSESGNQFMPWFIKHLHEPI
jgi:inosine-uridine nucleoside N-ribohydrolase